MHFLHKNVIRNRKYSNIKMIQIGQNLENDIETIHYLVIRFI